MVYWGLICMQENFNIEVKINIIIKIKYREKMQGIIGKPTIKILIIFLIHLLHYLI